MHRAPILANTPGLGSPDPRDVLRQQHVGEGKGRRCAKAQAANSSGNGPKQRNLRFSGGTYMVAPFRSLRDRTLAVQKERLNGCPYS